MQTLRAPALLVPGPVSLSPSVRSVLAGPVVPHYGADWVDAYRRVTTSLAHVLGTDGDVLLLFGPGSAALEMCLGSVLAPGDEVVVGVSGLFGERLAQIARGLGLTATEIATGPAEPLTAERLCAALDAHPEARALAIVHHEASSGLLHPLPELCGEAQRRGLLTVVDAVASLGGVALEMDAWGIDLCVAVANKCLGGPVGVAPVAVSPRAWAAVDDGRRKAAGWYLNLTTWRDYKRAWGAWHPTPTTMPSNAVLALGQAVDELLATGMDHHRALIARAAARVRCGLAATGCEPVTAAEHAAPVLTAAWAAPGMDVDDYIGWLHRERGLQISCGVGALAGRIFRVSHFGDGACADVVETFLDAHVEYLAAAAGEAPTGAQGAQW